LIKRERIDFLHPQPDTEVHFITKNKSKIEAKTLLPTYKTLELCQNKMALQKKLHDNGISVPESYHIKSDNDLKRALSKLLKKNEKVWLRATRGAGSKAALPVKKLSHAEMWIDYWKVMKGLSYSDFMVSEFLPGSEYAFQSFWVNGKLLMSQARERVSYVFGNLTPSGQSSSPSVAVTVHNEKVNRVASNAVKTADPKATGIYCVDLKTDKNGEPCIIEINAGRFFTTNYFFSKAGLNMPYFYTKFAIEGKIDTDFGPFNNLPAGLSWIRMIDMGYKLIKPKKWTSKTI
jgi:carbamoyl-phosphate synthase large subunit